MRDVEEALAFWCGESQVDQLPGKPSWGPQHICWVHHHGSSDNKWNQDQIPILSSKPSLCLCGGSIFPLYTLNSVSWNPGLCPSFYHPFLSHASHIHPCLANTSLANSNGFRLVTVTWCICVLLGVTTVWRLVWMWVAPSPRLGLDGVNREWGKDSLAQVCAISYFLAIKT